MGSKNICASKTCSALIVAAVKVFSALSVILTRPNAGGMQGNQSLVGYLALGFNTVSPSGPGAEWSLATNSPA